MTSLARAALLLLTFDLALVAPSAARAAGEATKASGPDLAMGTYRCAVFLNHAYVPVQKVTLAAGGDYATSTGGKGKYELSAKDSRIDFVSGPLEGSFGRIEADADHDRVIFRLNQKKDDSGSESKKNWSAQYCSPIKD